MLGVAPGSGNLRGGFARFFGLVTPRGFKTEEREAPGLLELSDTRNHLSDNWERLSGLVSLYLWTHVLPFHGQRGMLVTAEFRISEDVSSVHIQRFAPR